MNILLLHLYMEARGMIVVDRELYAYLLCCLSATWNDILGVLQLLYSCTVLVVLQYLVLQYLGMVPGTLHFAHIVYGTYKHELCTAYSSTMYLYSSTEVNGIEV
jgi:hypothetical protein